MAQQGPKILKSLITSRIFFKDCSSNCICSFAEFIDPSLSGTSTIESILALSAYLHKN